MPVLTDEGRPMRLPRVRFTVRRMMVAVAIFAIAVGAGVVAERMWRYSRDLRTQAAVHRATERLLVSHGNDREAEYHALMRRKYEDAARHPWKDGDAEVQRQAGNVRVTVEIVPKPDGEPYQDGEPIRCKGQVSWEDVTPPKKVKLVLQTGLFPDKNFPKCNERILPVKGIDREQDTRSGKVEWEGDIRANRVAGIDDYIIIAYPFARDSGQYIDGGTPIRGFAMLRIPR